MKYLSVDAKKLFEEDNRLMYYSHGCDENETCREVMLHVSNNADVGDMCVFEKYEDRLTKEQVTELRGILGESLQIKKTGASREDKQLAAERFDEMRAVLHKDRARFFPRTAKAKCTAHLRPCSVKCRVNRMVGSGHLARKRLCTAGVTCKGWCSPGCQLRQADPSQFTHALYITERIVEAEAEIENGAFTECACNYDVVTQQVEPLEPTHSVQWVKWGPQRQGVALGRNRSFVYAGAKWAETWTGPKTQDGVQTDFENFAATSMVCDGGAFFQATDPMFRREYDELLKKKTCRLHGG